MRNRPDLKIFRKLHVNPPGGWPVASATPSGDSAVRSPDSADAGRDSARHVRLAGCGPRAQASEAGGGEYPPCQPSNSASRASPSLGQTPQESVHRTAIKTAMPQRSAQYLTTCAEPITTGITCSKVCAGILLACMINIPQTRLRSPQASAAPLRSPQRPPQACLTSP